MLCCHGICGRCLQENDEIFSYLYFVAADSQGFSQNQMNGVSVSVSVGVIYISLLMSV